MKDTCEKLAYINALRAEQNAIMIASDQQYAIRVAADQQGSSNAEIPNGNAMVNEWGEY